MYSVLPPPSDEILAERVAKSAPPFQSSRAGLKPIVTGLRSGLCAGRPMTYSRQLPPLSPSFAARIIPILEIAGAEAPAPGNGSGGRFAGAVKSGVGRTLVKR